MTTTPQEPGDGLTDDDMTTGGAGSDGTLGDADGTDGADADGTDGTDGGDADGTDGGDADASDGDADGSAL
jgi:hypothetical protein